MSFPSIVSIPLPRTLWILLVLLYTGTVSNAEDILMTRRFTTADGLVYQTVRDTVQAQDGSVWFATWGGGVTRYDGTEWTTYTVDDGLVGNSVRALLFDEEGGLWAGTNEGIGYFDGFRWVGYTAANTPGLDADSVYCITRLRSGEIWFGFTDTRIQVFTPSSQTGRSSGAAGSWREKAQGV